MYKQFKSITAMLLVYLLVFNSIPITVNAFANDGLDEFDNDIWLVANVAQTTEPAIAIRDVSTDDEILWYRGSMWFETSQLSQIRFTSDISDLEHDDGNSFAFGDRWNNHVDYYIGYSDAALSGRPSNQHSAVANPETSSSLFGAITNRVATGNANVRVE